jgi:hypothetical protein
MLTAVKNGVYELPEDLLGVRGQDIEPGSTTGLAAHRRIGEDQGCPRDNQCTDILQKEAERNSLCLAVSDLSTSPTVDLAGVRMFLGLHTELAKRDVIFASG